MAILEKIKNILKEKRDSEEVPNKESEVTFLSSNSNSYTLYYQNSENKYVFVGDINYPYSKNDLDREWIDMNKHNFKVYEVFTDLSNLLEKNKEVVKDFDTQNVEYTKDDYKETEAENLPKGWKWGIYDDYSGSLISPTGKSYFCFDWQTREYQLTPKANYEKVLLYNSQGEKQTFSTFKKYAEKYTKENFADLEENQPVTIQKRIEKSHAQSKVQILNSRCREPLCSERNDRIL